MVVVGRQILRVLLQLSMPTPLPLLQVLLPLPYVLLLLQPWIVSNENDIEVFVVREQGFRAAVAEN